MKPPESNNPDKKHVVMMTTASLSYVLWRGQFKYLREQGYHVSFVSADGPEHESAQAEGAVTHAIAMEREPSPLKDCISLWRCVRLFRRERPDLLIVGTPKAGLLGGIAAAVAGVPNRIYVLMGLRLETCRGFKRWLLTACERIACASSDRVVCVSHSLREQAVRLGLADGAKLVVVGPGTCNGVDVQRFHPEPAIPDESWILRKKLGLDDSDFVIGFIGRLVRDKGIPELLEAFDDIQPTVKAKLVLVGDLEEGDPLPEQVRKRLGDHRNVVHVPFVTGPAPFYRVFNVLVLPTHREGFPNVVLEAQASACPVITTNATGAVESVVHDVTGTIVPVGNSRALSEGLRSLAANPEKARQMGRAGRARIEADFDQKKVWAQWAALYGEALRAGSRQRGAAAFVKSVGDRLMALLLLIVFSPLLVLVSLFVLITLGWPILFRQARPGHHGKTIVVHKFRTMSERRDPQGNLLSDTQRTSKAGRALRSLSLDELPQLWDVLRGRLSFVGPRPLLEKYRELYSPEQWRRHNVKPGITGWAQVNGRNAIDWPQKFALDVWYVDHWSLWLDVKILVRTLGRVLRRHGIAQAGYEGAAEFQGNGSAVAEKGKSQSGSVS